MCDWRIEILFHYWRKRSFQKLFDFLNTSICRQNTVRLQWLYEVTVRCLDELTGLFNVDFWAAVLLQSHSERRLQKLPGALWICPAVKAEVPHPPNLPPLVVNSGRWRGGNTLVADLGESHWRSHTDQCDKVAGDSRHQLVKIAAAVGEKISAFPSNCSDHVTHFKVVCWQDWHVSHVQRCNEITCCLFRITSQLKCKVLAHQTNDNTHKN